MHYKGSTHMACCTHRAAIPHDDSVGVEHDSAVISLFLCQHNIRNIVNFCAFMISAGVPRSQGPSCAVLISCHA